MSKQPARATPKRDRQRSPGSTGQWDKKSGVHQKTAVDPARAGAMSRAAPLFTLARPVQTKTIIGQSNDRYEQEADTVAGRISNGRPVPSVSRLGAAGPAGLAQRAGAEEEAEEELVQTKRVQRQATPDHTTKRMEETADQVTRNPPAGTPLPPAMRHKLESGLDTDLSGVRVHQGNSAETAAQQLQARAFTHQNHIWLGAGESVHDVELMAHEATHVVQQGAAPAPQTAAISRAPAQVQRLPRIIGEFLNDYAQQIPGYNLFTVIIGYNPLLGQRVERTAINLVQGLLGLLGPIGNYIFAKLQELNILQPAFTWVSDQLKRLDLSLSRLERTVAAAYDEMRLRYGFRRNLEIARRHFGRLYNDVVTFVQALVNQILVMIKEAAIGVAEELLAENRAWALTKKVIRYDPLRGEDVEASTVEILEDFLLLIGKETELAQMRERGTLQETADWLDTQWAVFSGLLGQLRGLITAAWDAIQPENLPNLITNLRALASQAFGFIQQVWDFALTIALKVLELVKNALLGWLSDVVHELPGFHLLTVILGRNPFTQEAVPRTPENIIRGFITLLPGGNAQYQQLEETGTIAQTAARIEGAMNELGISWPFIVGLFTGIWDSLSIQDLVQPVAAFQRIREQFGEPVSRLFAFVRVVITEIFKLVLEIMNFPSDLLGSIISNAMAAFESIRSNPVGFLLNMLAAVKLGFSNFFDNILQHLIGGLVDWLFRGLRQAGIQPPTDLSLASILDLVLQILGLTMDRIWQKVAERIGQENVDRIRGAMDRLVGIWTFIRDVQERGVAAIWEYIESQISGLWDMVLEQARNWIMERIVNRAIQWLLSLLDPTGIMPVINSFIAFFNAVQSAIEYMRDILAIINDYVSTLAAVARGALEAGAQKLQQGLANAIPIAIGFLANQFGLGNIGEKMSEIVGGIRSLIDRALDWLMDQAERAWQGLMGMLGFGGEEEDGAVAAEGEAWWELDMPFDQAGASHNLLFEGNDEASDLMVRSTRMPLQTWLERAQADLAAKQNEMDPVEYGRNETLLGIIASTAAEISREKQRFATLFETSQRRGLETQATSIGIQSGQEIRRLFLRIHNALQGLTFREGTNARPPSRLLVQETKAIGATGDQIGKVVVAQPLSINPGELSGSRPGGDRSVLFTRIKTARPGVYVQAHLLNDNLHGPGQTENLAPLPGQDNTLMSSRIEEPVKNAILSENKVVSFRMQLYYGGHSATNLSTFEQELATSIEGQAFGMRLKENVPATDETAINPDNWQVDRSDQIVPTVRLDVRMPTTSAANVLLRRLALNDDFRRATTSDGVPIPEVDARAAAMAVLSSVPGIGPTLADRVLDARPTSLAELEAVNGIGPERRSAILAGRGGVTIVLGGLSEWQ
jgi:hypothetical protein